MVGGITLVKDEPDGPGREGPDEPGPGGLEPGGPASRGSDAGAPVPDGSTATVEALAVPPPPLPGAGPG